MSEYEQTDEVQDEVTAGVSGEAAEEWLDDWVGRVAARAASKGDVHVLWGFIGKPALDDHVRLYLDVCAQYVVDIPRSEIVQRAPMSETSPVGGSILWITGEGWKRSVYHTPFCRS